MYLAPLVDVDVTCIPCRSGAAGAHQTLQLMRALIDEYKKHPAIRQAAIGAVYLHPERIDSGELEAIFSFVQNRIRYVRDVYDVETVSSPDKVLESRIGDCDDKTLLLCTMLESVGYPTRLVMAGYHDNDFEHVFCHVYSYDVGEWISADPTEHESLGFEPPMPTVYFVEG